jgi:hypothetical protein
MAQGLRQLMSRHEALSWANEPRRRSACRLALKLNHLAGIDQGYEVRKHALVEIECRYALPPK